VHLAATLEEAASPEHGRLSVVISRSSPDPGIHGGEGRGLVQGPVGPANRGNLTDGARAPSRPPEGLRYFGHS
jgi:hypothetical protein